MKKKRQKKAIKSSAKGKRIGSLKASASEAKRPYARMAGIGELYKPIKKPVTLRLDADVIAWFKARGRGYQTRINRALRLVMHEEIGDSGE